jgi:hypothetical protein
MGDAPAGRPADHWLRRPRRHDRHGPRRGRGDNRGGAGGATTLRRAGTPQERAAQARSLAALLALVAAFAVAFALVPGWYRFLVFLPFGLGLALLIRRGRRRAGVPTRAEPATGT